MTGARCSTKHPEREGLACILHRGPNGHPFHLAMAYAPGTSEPEQVRWPDPDYKSPQDARDQAVKAKLTVENAAARVRQEMMASAQQKPLGLKPGQRKKTRLGQVANLLANNVGVWLDGHRLETVEIGGSSGLRRLRELRDDYGWNIIQRPTATSTDQYQLVELPEEFRTPPTDAR